MFCFRGMGMILKDKRTRASCVKELWEALVRSSLSFIPIPLKQNILFLYTRMIFEIKKGGQLDPCWQIIFCQENPISVKRLETLSRDIAVDRKKSVNTWQKKNLSTLDRKKSVNTWQNSDKLCQGLTENFCQQLTCQELLINN